MNETEYALSRREGESIAEHHKRLVRGKLVDKTLSDYDYSELSKYVYGKEYAPDVARRMMYGSRKTLDLLENERINGTTDKNVLNEIDEKLIELRKERQRFFDQRREYNKLLSADGRKEYMYDRLIAAAEDLYDTVGNVYRETNCENDDEYSDNEAVLVFSDWHYGMIADNVFNKYNTEICVQRITRVVQEAVKRIQLHQCRKLHIVVLGDLIHGGIHASVRVASEELVCDQLMQASEILAQSIDYLSQFVNETVVYITYGNHARTIQNKKDNIHHDNMERIVPWWLEQRLFRNENVSIAPDTQMEFLFVSAAGHDLCASHGDIDSVKSSPRMLTTLFGKQYGKDIEYILLGDKHHMESFEELGVTSMICGALCGTDDYANDKRLYSTPSQLLLIFNPVDGLDAEYRLKCN